jgi:hypothetical protein
MRDELLGSTKLFVDETTVLDPGRGRTMKGYFWVLARDASSEFARHCGGEFAALGEFTLAGFSAPQQIFGLLEKGYPSPSAGPGRSAAAWSPPRPGA